MSLTVDTGDFARFASSLRQAPASLNARMTRNLREAGALVASEYKRRAYTDQGTTEVVAVGNIASIVVSGPPIVALEERSSGSWRHPVFGNANVWVSQKSHPALVPALMAASAQIYDSMVEAVQASFDQVAESSAA